MSLPVNDIGVALASHKMGKVILCGAGCGDPELLTVKAARWLQKAEVVLTDRLVSNEIIQQYVSATAEVIYVGKQCRRGFSTPQETINEMLPVRVAVNGGREDGDFLASGAGLGGLCARSGTGGQDRGQTRARGNGFAKRRDKFAACPGMRGRCPGFQYWSIVAW